MTWEIGPHNTPVVLNWHLLAYFSTGFLYQIPRIGGDVVIRELYPDQTENVEEFKAFVNWVTTGNIEACHEEFRTLRAVYDPETLTDESVTR